MFHGHSEFLDCKIIKDDEIFADNKKIMIRESSDKEEFPAFELGLNVEVDPHCQLHRRASMGIVIKIMELLTVSSIARGQLSFNYRV